MIPALILVDMQLDFLTRPGLSPASDVIVTRAAELLENCRKSGVPVIHVHTVVNTDSSNAMPHWKQKGVKACIKGTPGCSAPEALVPLKGEPVFTKQFFSAFRDGSLENTLNDLNVTVIIAAGIYLHGCIRATVLDAYERGFQVWVAHDVTADNEPEHGRITRDYLSERAANFLTTKQISERINTLTLHDHFKSRDALHTGYLRDRWLQSHGNVTIIHRNPSNPEEILNRVSCSSGATIAEAIDIVNKTSVEWRQRTPESQTEFLENWAHCLEKKTPDLVRAMALELGKPVNSGREEVSFTLKLLREVVIPAISRHQPVTSISEHSSECLRPIGVVAIITPWNNPVLIPVGKIAPALGFGNGVAWKPAPQAMLTTRILVKTLEDAGLSDNILTVLFGGAKTSADLITQPGIDAVSFTGSGAAGLEIARLCAADLKPLQAELGGNNAVIIMPDSDLEKIADDCARSAFSFAGQRCTATQRFIVHQKILTDFKQVLTAATKSLRLGDPFHNDTDLGPVISQQKRESLIKIVAEAVSRKAELLCGGESATSNGPGFWFKPTLLFSPARDLYVVNEEIFGPVAVIQSAVDWEEALFLLNSVNQGLVASLYTNDSVVQQRFLDKAECGILKLNQPTVGADPKLPFVGWKGSGAGPPEHGKWDEIFYTRPQARYG